MRKFLIGLMLTASPCVCSQQQAQQETPPSAVARQPGELSGAQQATFEEAQKSFAAGQWAESLALLKPLHEKHPRNAAVAKYAAEAAINLGDYAYAEANLKPLTQSGDDWQAHILLARCDAQQGRDADRDAELNLLTKMHAATTDPRFSSLKQFLVEKVPTTMGSLQILWSLVPVGNYKVYEMGRVMNADGKRVFLISLESNDQEQAAWGGRHPELAAKGDRFFSLDGYRDDAGPNGQVTQTHFTFVFFEDGRPSYNVVKECMVSIAEGKARPMSSRNGLAIPKS